MRRLAAAVLLLLAACGPSVSDTVPPAVWSGDGRKVAVAGRLGTDYGIYVFDPEGRQSEFIPFRGTIVAMKWAAQDGPIAAVVRHGNGKCYLWLVNRAGVIRQLSNRPVYIPKTPSANIVCWSPDNSFVAFSSPTGRSADIWRVRLALSEETRLTDGRGWNTEPAWSPDGGRIAFTSSRGGTLGIWTCAASGGSIRKVYDGPDAEQHASWSPDSKRLAFVSKGKRSGIYTVGVLGGTPRPVSVGGSTYAAPVWSSTGKWIAFVYGHNPSNIFATRVEDKKPSGTNFQTSFDSSTGTNTSLRVPVWSPSHDQLIYATYEDGRLGIRRATLSEKHGPSITYVYTSPVSRGKRARP